MPGCDMITLPSGKTAYYCYQMTAEGKAIIVLLIFISFLLLVTLWRMRRLQPTR
jgi:hypothetical protein